MNCTTWPRDLPRGNSEKTKKSKEMQLTWVADFILEEEVVVVVVVEVVAVTEMMDLEVSVGLVRGVADLGEIFSKQEIFPVRWLTSFCLLYV